MKFASDPEMLLQALQQLVPEEHKPEVGERGLQWPELVDDVAEPTLVELHRLLNLRTPRHQTKRGFSSKIVAALAEYHESVHPKNHPSDLCGACREPMPWRRKDAQPEHKCKTCAKPVHGQAWVGCPVVVVNDKDFYCNETCLQKPDKKARRK